MSAPLTVSVVIVSRDRPDALRRCLTGLAQQFLHPFEVVVVGDRASRQTVATLPLAAQAKLIAFDEANISRARNRGIAAAAGEVVAFIDDDSVPEPTWLQYLTAPFERPEVEAAGGFVRGRNGISWQSRGTWIDGTGTPHPLDVPDDAMTLLTGRPGMAIKTEGTNMAFRRSWLAETGGFDPRYHFFLDETDMNMRLAAARAVTAVTPRAQVHHGFAASVRRGADRVPRDLTEIGASWAVFLAKYCPEETRDDVWARVLRRERRRLLQHLIRGGLEPRDLRRLMAGLRAGHAQGVERAKSPVPMPPLPQATDPFSPYAASPPTGSEVIAGRIWSRRRLRRQAAQAVASGKIVTLMRFSLTALFHRVSFRPEGWWQQTGGIFGRSERRQPLFRLTTFKRRKKAEIDRIREIRGCE